MMQGKPTVFISYSHKDKEWMKRLVTHLVVLEKQGLLSVWEDTRIDGGDEWYPEIKDSINEASIAVMLISADFLTSDFILKEEVPRLLELRSQGDMIIIPIVLRPCSWKAVAWLKEIQNLPGEGKSVTVNFANNWDVPFEQLSDLVYRKINEPSFKPAVRILTEWPILSEDCISIESFPVTGSELFGRQKEMELLDGAWDEGNLNTVSFVAWGGVGKSTLINKWIESMKAENFRGAERVYCWSFYSQGTGEKVTSADLFINEALQWFGDSDSTAGSPWDKGQKLADLVRKEKTLLVLDGVEPLQSEHENGKIKDAALSVLIEELSKENSGLLIITTREVIPELEELNEKVSQENLEQITPEAGRALLRTAGVRGTDKELEDASRLFGNQALALRLLGSWLYDEEGHRIEHASKIPDLEHIPEDKGRHSRRVMAAFEERFGEGAEVELLRMLGLFDRPAEQGAIKELLKKKVIPHLTWHFKKLTRAAQKDLLVKLRRLKLIAEEGRHGGGKIDAHPLVREHFGEQLEKDYPDAWREGNSRLYEYFKKQGTELPDNIEDMSPLYTAVAHGCAAGRHQDVMDEVYRRRILRGEKFFSIRQLGAFGADLACVSHFFKKQWHMPVAELSEGAKASILNGVGFILRALGRLKDAMEPMQAGLDMSIAHKQWKFAAIVAGNLSEVYLAIGEIDKAIEYSGKGVQYADKSEDDIQKMSIRSAHADALHQVGRIEEAERLFCESGEIQKKYEPEYPYLYSLPGYRYCDLLLGKVDYEEVLKRAKKTLELVLEENWLLDIAQDHLSLGRANLFKVIDKSTKDYTETEKHLNEAVDGLRKANDLEFIARGLLARAELFRIKKDYPKSKHDLDEALTIAKRGEMKLHETDCHLGYARLYLAMNEKEKARTELSTAKKMINETGYHRRDKDVKEIEEFLG